MSMGTVLASADTVMAAAGLVCMVVGWRAIRRKDVARHRRFMILAFGFNVVFMVLFVVRLMVYGVETIRPQGAWRVVAITLATLHEPPAVVVAPPVVITLIFGLTGRYRAHKEVATTAFPLSVYVSVTGIL